MAAGLGEDGGGELHPENTSSPAHIIAGILSGFMSSRQVSVTKLKPTPVPATLIRVYGNTWRLFDMNERQPGRRSHHQALAAEPQPVRPPAPPNPWAAAHRLLRDADSQTSRQFPRRKPAPVPA